MSNSDAESAGALERAAQKDCNCYHRGRTQRTPRTAIAMHPERRVWTEAAGNIGSAGSARCRRSRCRNEPW